MRTQPSNKILPLETLRGIAALVIVFSHFNSNNHISADLRTCAWLMVEFFFVLSGFVISLNYSKRITNISSFLNFQKKRFLRLYPLHITIIAIMFFIEVIRYYFVISGKLHPYTYPFTGYKSGYSLFMNLFLLHSFFVNSPSWNTPSWSVSAEFYIYMLFCIMVLFREIKPRLCTISVLCVIIISRFLLIRYGFGTDTLTGPVRCIYSFFIGNIIYIIYDRFPFRVNGVATSLLLFLSVFVVLVSRCMPIWMITYIPIIFSVTILFIAHNNVNCNTFQKIMSLRPLVFLGTISYSIYMWHSLVIYIITSISRKIFHVTFSHHGMDLVLQYPSRYAGDVLAIAAAILSVIISAYSYKYLERRFYSHENPPGRTMAPTMVKG